MSNTNSESSLYNMFKDLGLVVSISDGIVGVKGLDNVANGEVIDFLVGSKKITGMVLNLEPDKISAVVLGDDSEIKPGQIVARKFDLMGVPVGESLLGRVVDPLGNPLDNMGPITSKGYAFVEKIAPSIISRTSVNIPLETGLKVVDSMVPIGHGQRELIIGDMKTGKTAVALDTIINQKGTDTLCIYVAMVKSVHLLHVLKKY